MPKSVPTIGQAQWGEVLNNHLSQSINPANGGLNSWADASARPAVTSNDIGKTGINIATGEIERYNGSSWEILTLKQASNISFLPTTTITQATVQGAITNLDNRVNTASTNLDNLNSWQQEMESKTATSFNTTTGNIENGYGGVPIVGWTNPSIQGNNTFQRVFKIDANESQSNYQIFPNPVNSLPSATVLFNVTMGDSLGDDRLVATIIFSVHGGTYSGSILNALKYAKTGADPDIRIVNNSEVQVKFDNAGVNLTPIVYVSRLF